MNSIESFAFVITFLLGGVILVGCFIILVVLKSTPLKQSRFFLGVSIFGLIQHLFTYLLFTTQLVKQWPHLLGVGYPLLYLVGPCFYLFVKSYGDPTFRLKKIDVLHIVPFLIMLVLFIPKYLGNIEEKQAVIQYYYDILPNGGVKFSDWLQASLHLILLFVYAVFGLLLIYKRDKKNSILLKRFSFLLIFLAVAELILQTGFILTGVSAITTEIILSGLMSITVLLLGYWIVDIKQIFPVLEGKKYKTSPLSDTRSEEIQQQIQVFFCEEKRYLDPNLKIADLSHTINVPSHHISQVLSERMNSNFYEILNHHRIEKAKEMLQSGALQKISVQAIGEECGFSSKTSFYRAFKKITSMTPKQYVEKTS
ncbi:helix-turn-helix domain-containing protein [Aquimarina mytili]|uniref:Helix-turn-helix transcriptional regulator n=1 Tax=Aquimarina mytili TaxID=874423 RepID=A0A937D8T6_9FLAO|nr:helix-turn-helix transcriptional regulator [Aquimarina mytili]MBL0684400.1 helix-turn-helix transcriptional regulator [Aquimarina mytili]